MSRYFVEKVKFGLADSGLPPADVIVSIEYRKDDGSSQWLSNAECEGFCTIYQNDFDPFELLISGDVDDPKWAIGMTNSFEGIDFYDYEDMFDYFLENENNPAIPLLRLLIAVTRCNKDETNLLISNAEGKYIDEIDVPISDIEEDYLETIE
ncbi:hypothetical protein SAMN04487934_11818 [Eubacterium ruminantium]|nr:hypothetical protein SAMN04487934_11818 [Eubacterium ruminantium]